MEIRSLNVWIRYLFLFPTETCLQVGNGHWFTILFEGIAALIFARFIFSPFIAQAFRRKFITKMKVLIGAWSYGHIPAYIKTVKWMHFTRITMNILLKKSHCFHGQHPRFLLNYNMQFSKDYCFRAVFKRHEFINYLSHNLLNDWWNQQTGTKLL